MSTNRTADVREIREARSMSPEIRQLVSTVFRLQEKIAQIAQVAVELSAQAAGLATNGVDLTQEPESPAPPRAIRNVRGTMVGEEVPTPPAASRPVRRAKAQAPKTTVTSQATTPKTTASAPKSSAPKSNAPKSSIELTLTNRPMSTKQLATAISQSLEATTEVLKVLEEDGKVYNLGFPDKPLWTWRLGDGIGDDVPNADLEQAIVKLLTNRWLPIRTLIAATGVRIERVDGVMTKLKRAGRVEVRKEAERGRSLIYTMRNQPDPKHPYLRSNKIPKTVVS